MLTPEECKIGRRTFLKALATLPAVGAFGWAAYKERLHQRPVQAGIIGSGSEGCVLLEQAPQEMMQFKAVADIRPDSRKNGLDTIKKRWGNTADVDPEYQQLLDRKDIEAVVIATPLWAHARIAVDALNAGKHVFVEKTMAYTLPECKEMALAAVRNQRVLQVGHQRHSNRLYAQALQMIRDGMIGEIYHIRTLWHRNNDWRRPVPPLGDLQKLDAKFDPTRWGYGSIEELVNWRLYRKYSQGLPAELASHQLDVTNWFSGTVPTRILGSGGVYKWKDGRNIEDHVYLTCEYPAGPITPGGLTVTFSSITSNAFDNYYEQFMGTKGTIIITGETDAMLFKEGEAPATEIEVAKSAAGAPVMSASRSRIADAAGGQAVQTEGQPTSGLDRLEPYRLELEAFCSAIKFGTDVPCTAQTALAAAVLVAKANEAIREHKVLELGADLYNM